MKTLITSVALVTLIAAPALAQTKRAPAQQSQSQVQQKHSANIRNDVYVSGRYVGSDPDAFIRLQMQADPEQGGNGSSD
jgi:hypothetical protein